MTTFSLMSETDRREAGRFWLDALAAYRADEVRQAFIDFTHASDRNYPNPQEIVRLIRGKRKEVGRRIAELERQAERSAEPEREPCDPDTANDILQRYGFAPKRMVEK